MSVSAASTKTEGLPDGFGEWPVGARRAYLEASLDRDALLDLVAERAGLSGAGGEPTKYELARIAVALANGGAEA